MQVQTVKTVRGGKRFAVMNGTDRNSSENLPIISVHPEITFQTIQGFGGAFTEAAACTLDQLSAENREKVLELYFDAQKGIGYTLGRIPMGSCDFSLGNYSYVADNDRTLSTFSIERDKEHVIPMVRDAMRYAKNLRLMATPWSPPAYMKTNGDMNHGGRLKKEYAEQWAACFEKFIMAYRAMGIHIQAVTVQNEPNADPRWDSCMYSAEEERDFIIRYLGERMKKLNVSIYFWDHNKDEMLQRAGSVMPLAEQYVCGMAFHWYTGDHFEQLEMVHSLYPRLQLAFTEGCYEYSHGKRNTTQIGEGYAHDMIGNFNHFCNSFCDWNLLLDERGGPNHVGNYCDAPIMADTKNDRILINDSYFYIGHFSRFIRPGAKRIGLSRWSDELEASAFRNPDRETVIVVLNRNDTDREFSFRMEDRFIHCISEGHSIATYLIRD